MCGIAGALNAHLNIDQLRKDLHHRGPDENGTWEGGVAQLHHQRLSIVDLACGKQPMRLGSLVIVFNGEIYNHLDLRSRFSLECSTGSDTETILHLYLKLGEACLAEMDGMFAFAIFDEASGELFIARDRAGKKPVYYHRDNERFYFASEVGSLASQLRLRVNTDHIHQYLRMGYFFRSATPYLGLLELPAGSWLKITKTDPEPVITKWWNIHEFYLQQSTDTFEEALNRTDELLHLAVRRRVESSDLEVGSFLSGGIDSGLVTAIARNYNPRLKTFTVSFNGQYDEAPLAAQVAAKYGTDHHEIRIGFDNLLADVETILGNYGEPFFDSSAIPSYYVSKAAREHLTVILNGDGGDELFGGYRRYVPFARYDFFKPGALVKAFARMSTSVLPAPNQKKSRYNYLYRLLDFAGKSGLDTYLSATIDIFEGYTKYLKAPAGNLDPVRREFEKISGSRLTGLGKIINLDFDNILAGDLLVKMDIATMAHSLEGRSPLLSKELLEYVPSLPDSYRIRGGQTKVLLRTLSERYLPADLIHQPKRGFEIPLKSWVNNELKPMIDGHLRGSNAYCRNFIDAAFLTSLLDDRVKVGAEKRAKMIWALFALEVWYQQNKHRLA